MTTTVTSITDFACGDALELDHTITGLPAQITSCELGLRASRATTTNLVTRTITTSSSASGQIINAGTVQTDGTYTAEVAFLLTGGAEGDTVTYFTPGVTTWGYCTAYVSTAPYTAEVLAITPDVGGKYG